LDDGPDEIRPEGLALPKAKAEPIVKLFLLQAGSLAGETVRAGMVQRLTGVVSFVEDVKLELAAGSCRVVRGDLHKVLSFNGLQGLCMCLVLNRLRPHNKTEEEKNQEKKKKNPRRQGSLEAKARPQVNFLCMKNALTGRSWCYA